MLAMIPTAASQAHRKATMLVGWVSTFKGCLFGEKDCRALLFRLE